LVDTKAATDRSAISEGGHRALRSLRGIEVPRRAPGGAVDPSMMSNAAMAANPMMSGLYSEYAGLPTEKLHELAMRMPQNPLVKRALQQRQMQPQADPSLSTQSPMQAPQAGTGAPGPAGVAGLGTGLPGTTGPQQQSVPGSYAAGGDVGDDEEGLPIGFGALAPWMQGDRRIPRRPDIGITAENTSDWRDEAPPLGQTAGVGPQPNSTYADFRMPQGGGPQDYPQPAQYADSRLMPGGMPQDQLPIAGMVASPPPHVVPAAYHPSGQTGGLAPPPPARPSLSAVNAAPPTDTGEPTAMPHGGGGHGDFMSGPWGTLLAAGLGIMGGTSPFPGVNIGRGALEGLKFGESQRLREEQQALRMQQAADLAQYRRDMAGVAGRRADTGLERAGTYQQATDQRGQYQQGMLDSRNTIAARSAELRARGLDQQAANQQALMEWRQGNQDISRGRAVTSAAQGQYRLDQADQRIANSQANAQAAQAIRRQALQQTKDIAEQRMIQTATNSDIHAAASLAGSTSISFGKALQQVQSGRGSAEAGQGVAPGTTTGTAPDQNKPPLSSIFGQ